MVLEVDDLTDVSQVVVQLFITVPVLVTETRFTQNVLLVVDVLVITEVHVLVDVTMGTVSVKHDARVYVETFVVIWVTHLVEYIDVVMDVL